MKPLFLFSFLFVAVICEAQNYMKAVLYKTDGSKTDCFIKSRAYEGTQQKFEYSLEEGGALKSFDAAELSKVEFEDGMILEKYFINVVNIRNKPIERRQADYENPDNKVTGWFLIEKLISGSYSLYQFVDKYQNAHFFYKTKNDTSVEKLFYVEYANDDAVIVNKREFRNQLLYLATNSGCAEKLTTEISNSEYRFGPMVSVFKKLNGCTGEKTELNSKVYGNKGIIRFSVMAGGALTRLTFKSPNPGYYPGLSSDKFSSSLSPAVGISVDFVPKKRQKNYIFSLELLYNYYSSTTDSIHYNTYTTGIGGIKFSTVSLNPVIRLRLSRSQVMPFVEGGVSLRMIVSKEDYYLVKTSSEVTRPIFNGRGNSLGVLGGAGIDFKRFSIHARYCMSILKNDTYYNSFFLIGKINFAKSK